MASYRGHLAVSASLGIAYGAAGFWHRHFDWGPALLGAELVALGGLLPDVDSDSGVLVRELFGLAATISFLLFIPRLHQTQLTAEQMLVALTAIYLFVRFVIMTWFNRLTAHRGMFHSIPAMLISGLTVFLLYGNRNADVRNFLAGGIMLGFLSHLVLDEICAIDVRRLHVNRFSGTALKWVSPSWSATILTYMILIGLAGLAWLND